MNAVMSLDESTGQVVAQNDRYTEHFIKRYFAEWTDVGISAFDRRGVTMICSSKRDKRQAGRHSVLPLYCVVAGKTIVISYSSQLKDIVRAIKDIFEEYKEHWQVKPLLQNLLHGDLTHCRKFYIAEGVVAIDSSKAERLHYGHYVEYLSFFKSQNPGVSSDWLAPHFQNQVKKKYAYGYFHKGRLVSVTDVLDVPYLENIIVEPCITTTKEYRNRGYGKIVSAKLMQYLQSVGKIPVFSCNINHKASLSLAKSLGLVKFCDVISWREERHENKTDR